MVPSPDSGAPNLIRTSRAGRPHGLFPCAPPAGALTCWPFKTPPPPHPPHLSCPPSRIASGTCSPPSSLRTPHPAAREVLRGIGGEGRGEGRALEAVRARSRGFRLPVAKGRPRRARPRCSVPSPRPPRREARARPPAACRGSRGRLGSPRLSPRPSILLQPPSREARAAPGAGGREGRDEKPARLGVGAPCEDRAGGDARRGGLDRRVGGLPPPPAPPAGLGPTPAASDPEWGPRLA